MNSVSLNTPEIIQNYENAYVFHTNNFYAFFQPAQHFFVTLSPFVHPKYSHPH